MELAILDQEKSKEVKFQKEPLISFIVPVHAGHLDPSVYKRCLMSLDDQDYPNMEVITVINGGTDESLNRIAEFFSNKDSKKFRTVQIEEGGACHARNVGFEHSKGEIVSFFNSDYRAKPGMVTMWVETLLEHPECGFVYGGYEYSTAPAQAYWSKEFDPYLLDVANFIDCGFPLWRKYVVKWDTEVKSLQDWDFWLRVVKTHNIKGHYISRDLSFLAEPPRVGGLSHDSGKNWIERVKFIKKKNNIPMSDLVVTSVGAPNHGIKIAKMLKADYRDDTIYKPNEYKAIYMIGFYMKPGDQSNDHPRILGSFPESTKKIIHFVGADIYWLRKFPYESMKILAGVIKMGSHHILCENETSQKELHNFGIEADIVPIPTYNDYEVKPIPEEFKVSLYLTQKSDFDKYFMKHTLSIVQAMPYVKFTGYGDGFKEVSFPNFKHYGNMDDAAYKEYVYNNSCLLRLVRHDTLPLAACDFFSSGRHVISNIPLEYGHLVSTSGDSIMDAWDIFAPGFNDLRWPATKKKIIQKINEVRNLPLNLDASVHYKRLLDKNAYIHKIYGMSGIEGGSQNA